MKSRSLGGVGTFSFLALVDRGLKRVMALEETPFPLQAPLRFHLGASPEAVALWRAVLASELSEEQSSHLGIPAHRDECTPGSY